MCKLFWTFFFISVKPHWKLVVAQIILSIIWAMDFVIRPYLVKKVVDMIPQALASGSTNILSHTILLYLCLATLVFLVFRLYEYTTLIFAPHLIKSIGLLLSEKLFQKPHIYFQNKLSGSLANKVSDVSSGILDILTTLTTNLFGNILALLLGVYTVYAVNLWLSVLLALWVIVFFSLSLVFSSKATMLSRQTAEKRSSVGGLIVDMLSNILSVKAFTTENHELSTLGKLYNKFISDYQRRDWFLMKIHCFQDVSFILYQLLCFVWLMSEIQSQTVTAGDFALIMMLNVSIVNALGNLSRTIRNFSESYGNTMQGLQTILMHSKEEYEASQIPEQKEFNQLNNKKLIVHKGKIILKKIQFCHIASIILFNKLSLTLEPYQKVGIVGYSGSGKTTFINLLLGFIEVQGGQILIDNQDITQITKESLRQNISFIPQDITLFHRSLMENIRYGRINASDQEVIEAAKKAGAHGFIEQLPEKYDSFVGERGIKLSGGERQRIAIARAILKNAPILILDEVTNQLDSITETQIQTSLNALMQNKTTIIIAHRLSSLLHLDRILVFNKGSIVQDGVHKDLIKQNGLYKTLWDNQSHGFLPIYDEMKP